MTPAEDKKTSSRQALDALFASSLPSDKRLFHYTDAGGLLGMAQHQKLWMTNLHYQNDSQEYYYAFNLLKKIIRDEYPGLLTEAQLEGFGTNMSMVFTFSLSEERDSLSQWRGYCPKGGYALSFDREQLNKIIGRDYLRIARCRYNEDEQRDFLIKNVIEITPEEYKKANGGASLAGGPRPDFSSIANYLISYDFFEYMRSLAPIFKHPSFYNEKEWRLIKIISGDHSNLFTLSEQMGNIRYQNLARLRVRVSNNRIIPYKEISLKFEEQPIKFEEVVVGPTAHKELALDACQVLLNVYESERYHQVVVKNSEIPYVNW